MNEAETQRLARLFARKLAALEALKKSLRTKPSPSPIDVSPDSIRPKNVSK